MNWFRRVMLAAAGGELPTEAKARVGVSGEPLNVSSHATVVTVQNAIRAAESGDTRELFALYRDLVVGGSHIQSEFVKRKMGLLGATMSIQPADKKNAEDVRAVDAVRWMAASCSNWLDGMVFLLDSALWPVSVVEKIYRPVAGDERSRPPVPLRWTLAGFAPVNHALLCFQSNLTTEYTEDTEDRWEPDIRLYEVDGRGVPVFSTGTAYALEMERHLVHRGHALVGVRDCWGGPMRAVVFWWLLGVLGRDWFARSMERFGSPWPVAKTDTTNPDAVRFLQSALSLSTKVGGLVVDNDTEVQLIQSATTNSAQAYEIFLSLCNREISKVVVGQTLSGEAQPTGLGSGTSALHGQVREDIRQFDQAKLAATLQRQLFEPFLRINGLRGAAPNVVWGGETGEEAQLSGALLSSLAQAGLQPTEDALPVLSEKFGFPVERATAPGGAGMPPKGGTLTPSMLTALSAQRPPDFVDQVAARRGQALAEVYRGSMAPFRLIVLNSSSREECLERLAGFYADWKPERLVAEMETALQICAAAGAAEATDRE